MFDGYINTATLKKRFENKPLIECYAVRSNEVDSYYMVIPIDGERLVLSTWRSEIAKPFRRAGSLIKEAESFGFSSIKFGTLEEDYISDKEKFGTKKLGYLNYWLSNFSLLGIKLKINHSKVSEIDTGVDDILSTDNKVIRDKIKARLIGNVHPE
jgi:hypothetical protein